MNRWARRLCLGVTAALSLMVSTLPASTQAQKDPAPQLPTTAPAPEELRPEEQQEPPSTQAPIPEKRPETPSDAGNDAEDQQQPPDRAPLPTPSPTKGGQSGKTVTPEAAGEDDAAKPRPPAVLDPLSEPPSAEELACQARLTELGSKFEKRPGESDPAGCLLPHPVLLTSFGADIAIEPPILVNCATAETATRFVLDVVVPEIRSRFATSLKRVEQQSGYVCRPRNGSSKLSEHAFGNAIDFGSFTLADGRTLRVESSDDIETSAFLTQLRLKACGPFKTVLGPGSDEDHATHLHLDLAARRKGGTFCQ